MNETMLYILGMLTLAFILLGLNIADGMEVCQQTHSFDTCHYALNR